MYQPGDQVVYGIHGVCVILGTEEKTVDRQKISYLILEPIDQPGSRFYIPKDKPAAVAKLNPLLTVEEARAMLFTQEDTGNAWIADENRRKLHYRELIASADRKALLSMVRALHRHKKEQQLQGKKFHQCDENFLRDAQKLLCSEFSLVLGLSYKQIISSLEQDA